MSMRLKGRRALVTGAGGGLGYEIALELAREGADVYLHYGHESELARAEEVMARIISLERITELHFTNFLNLEAIPELVKHAVDLLGGLDIVVNNAGITLNMPVGNITVDHINLVSNVNQWAPLMIVQSARKALEESGRASVINLSSVHAFGGNPGHSVYAATKAGIIGLTQELAIELAPKIRVNAVAPGHIVIPGLATVWPEYDEAEFAKRIPVGFCGQPIDVAKAVAFLASDDSRYINGTCIRIDGGNGARMNYGPFSGTPSDIPFGRPYVPGV
ncbi:MAG: hypothetical protein A3E36_00515 [Candidatus Andersenbacteria bacterium RIFCSPHIGHO2_12_FULL_45_11b]|uniref:Short-chain dehydrogenase n=1 Tax=Candidatus Andersenbacteria bacterium RIFCSPHIGHO2_12_FULL_45_11b TaxID=1797282 RepID=A0A1G1XAK8_9BACT|nr:MAG: hypothetical protein A3E36_00515 [Candidatus Andersenbacteria bacterium RIFCSPHIGHO2_12_FULL_45_11b]